MGNCSAQDLQTGYFEKFPAFQEIYFPGNFSNKSRNKLTRQYSDRYSKIFKTFYLNKKINRNPVFLKSTDVHSIFVYISKLSHEMFTYCQFHPKSTSKPNKICFIYKHSVNDILSTVGTYFKAKAVSLAFI